jgi:hypothetical protein
MSEETQIDYYITNGVNSHHCNSLEAALLLGQYYATELQGEIMLYVDGVLKKKIKPKKKPSTPKPPPLCEI